MTDRLQCLPRPLSVVRRIHHFGESLGVVAPLLPPREKESLHVCKLFIDELRVVRVRTPVRDHYAGPRAVCHTTDVPQMSGHTSSYNLPLYFVF